MNEREALLAAAIADPDDDTPRLVLADWLEEHGDEHDRARAEYIRIQCELGRLSSDNPVPSDRVQRATDLHTAHAGAWMGPLWGFTTDQRARTFDRGLLECWHSPADAFLRMQQQMVSKWFSRVGVVRLALGESNQPHLAPHRIKALVDSPALAWVAQFSWHRGYLNDADLRIIALSPHTSRWSRFEFSHPHCSDAGMEALADSRSFPNLRGFALNGGVYGARFSTRGILSILNSERLPKLDRLEVTGALPGSYKIGELFLDPALERLRVLCQGSLTNLSELVSCPHLTNLETLVVIDSVITDANIQTFLDNPAFAKLRSLTLYNINDHHAPLSIQAEERLRERFREGSIPTDILRQYPGTPSGGLNLHYSPLVRRG